MRSGQSAESTGQLLGMYELAYTGGKIKAFTVEGSKKTELDLAPNELASQRLLSWVGSSEAYPLLKFPISVG